MNGDRHELDTGSDADSTRSPFGRPSRMSRQARGGIQAIRRYRSPSAMRPAPPTGWLFIVAAVAGCVLFSARLSSTEPTPLLGSLLVWIGAAVTFEWAVLTACRSGSI
jgi:hypothetical protein